MSPLCPHGFTPQRSGRCRLRGRLSEPRQPRSLQNCTSALPLPRRTQWSAPDVDPIAFVMRPMDPKVRPMEPGVPRDYPLTPRFCLARRLHRHSRESSAAAG